MRRLLVNLISGICLLLAVVVCAAWVRSYWVHDTLLLNYKGRGIHLHSLGGTATVVEQYWRGPETFTAIEWLTEPAPEFPSVGRRLIHFGAGLGDRRELNGNRRRRAAASPKEEDGKPNGRIDRLPR